MSAEYKTGKNIWDVIFSQDKHHFPIQRNYLIEPRGSLNPINRLVTQEVCLETVDYVRENITDPYELYVLDFELNYTIRKLVDFILYVDLHEYNGYWEEDGTMWELFPPLEFMCSVLDNFYKWDENIFCCCDFRLDISAMPFDRDNIKKGKYNYSDSTNIIDAAKLQQAVQYVIESSDFDWKTKAEAFLRASSERGFSPADDETIIYLMSQSLDDKELKKEAQHRWERYKKEWEDMFFTDKNPYKGKTSIDRLRFIHWDKLSSLRPLEPQLQGEKRDTYNYKVESQHLLSPEYVSDFAKVFSLFRTDLDVDPIQSHLVKLITKYHYSLSESRDFEYNYTVTDLCYLSDLLFTFACHRFRHDIDTEDNASFFVYKTRGNVALSFEHSTTSYSKDVSMVTLVALEVHAIYYSHPKGMIEFLQKAKQWLLSQQTPYGYWYDGANNPEYTTVLVLDALNLIDENDGLTFPITTKPRYDKTLLKITVQPYLIVNYVYRSLFLGNREICFTFRGGVSKTWDFIKALIVAKQQKMPLPRYLWIDVNDNNDDNDDISEVDRKKRHDWKNEYDILSRKLGGAKIIKQFIISSNGTYHFNNNVTINSHSAIRPIVDSDIIDNR